MALASLSELDKYKAARFPPGYPDATRTLCSPVDQIHDALGGAAHLGQPKSHRGHVQLRR
jgi:hypothetical protein